MQQLFSKKPHQRQNVSFTQQEPLIPELTACASIRLLNRSPYPYAGLLTTNRPTSEGMRQKNNMLHKNSTKKPA
jgi:hypothetical protein